MSSKSRCHHQLRSLPPFFLTVWILSVGMVPGLPVKAQESKEEGASVLADDVHRTWLKRIEAEDRFPTAAACSQCHPKHYQDWSSSPHAYAMMSPVFNSMHAKITTRTAGTTGDFCIRCHTPVGMQQEEEVYGSVLLRAPIVVEGVTCIVCHRIDRNFGTASGRLAIKPGPLNDPIFGPTGNAKLKDAIKSDDYGLVTDDSQRGKLVHGDIHRSPVISSSALCASCHDVNSPAGIRLESAATEFRNSPASKKGQNCQDCHMNKTPGAVPSDEKRHAIPGRDSNFDYGPAAWVRNSPLDPKEGIPTPSRKLTNHMFIGPDYSIVHPGIYPQSVEAPGFTYTNRFLDSMSKEMEGVRNYLKKITDESEREKKEEAAKAKALKNATLVARRHALSDWISFRWWEGWGTPEFEEELSDASRAARLKGVGFPWADEKDLPAAKRRRETARLILAHQFNQLNRAHVARTHILRRALQIGDFKVVYHDQKGLKFKFDILNVSEGHAVPTGFDAERVMYLEVTVRDAKGRKIYQSGDRDPNGDLRDLHSAYVHASAPKTGRWADANAWKAAAGLPLMKEDKMWRPDAHLMSLQSKFVSGNLTGGEREQILALNLSPDPVPFVRPSTQPDIHSGRAGSTRKQFRGIPPLGKRLAEYRIDCDQLTGAYPYNIDVRLISQMVPVNLIKRISSVGFDYNLSAGEVARRVAFGHVVDTAGNRKGGAVTIWQRQIQIGEGDEPFCNLQPSGEDEILHIPVADYPFPHTSEEEIQRRRQEASGGGDAADFMVNNLGPYLPEVWPFIVPDGLPLIPSPSDSLFPFLPTPVAPETPEKSE
ncbi:MAG: multiheme c-type cytochrome [Verrucomicrobiales bacterium]|nr:multiheme c-type cytochrome [Verrucomicrobiales bacterium]